MEIKKIKVINANGVVKEIEAHQEKDYKKNGWQVVQGTPTINNTFGSIKR